MDGNLSQDVSIIGTGDFARTFAKKLATHGYKVTIGSRFPNDRSFVNRDISFAAFDVKIVAIEECISASDVIFLAIHADKMKDTLIRYKALLKGKILVDVSNIDQREKRRRHGGDSLNWRSNAEDLADVFGKDSVVKAFNTISAYELDQGELASDRKVYICGENTASKLKVECIARNAGFTPVLFGGLHNAEKIETAQTEFWQGWGLPVGVSTGSFVLWGIYGTMRYQVWKGNPWSMWPVNTLNKVFACAALSNLALCYIPGCIGAGLQIVRGTKHKPFPGWLDCWLKMRKQLGLIALYMAGTHCVMSVAHLSAPYFPNWYDVKNVLVPANSSQATLVPLAGTRMNLWGESVISLGVISLGWMSVLGLTSIPSVGTNMNWVQWNFVHTNMGYGCLAVASLHVLLKGLPDWSAKPLVQSAKGMAFLSLVLPVIALTSRTLLSLPGIHGYLAQIRQGWERGRNPGN